jgi:DHA1 family bicyclomycin/chloramphenicol resistance-like MFS transporter
MFITTTTSLPWTVVTPADAEVLAAAELPRPRGTAEGKEFIALVVAMMITTSFAIDLMLPAFPDMRRHFGMAADSTAVTWTVTAYFDGLAIGPWLYGPASDRYGRRGPLFVGLSVCIVAAALAALAPTWWLVVLARFLWGLGAGAPRTLSMAIIRDRYDGDAMARLMSLMMAVFMLAPVVAPLLGSALISVFPWQTVFWFPVLVAGITMVWMRRLPETLPPERRRPLSFRSVMAAIGEVLHCRQTMLLTLTMTIITGIITAFIAASQVMIEGTFGHGNWFSPCFASVAVVMGVNSLLTARRVHRSGAERIVRINVIGAVVVAAALAAVSVTGGGRPNFWLFLVVWAAATALSQSVNPTSNALAMAPLPHIAGTTSSVIATITAAGGAFLGGPAANSFDGTVRPYAFHFLAYTVLAAITVFAALHRRQPRTA